jgi:hypothetical protein
MHILWADVPRYHGGVVKKLEQPETVTGKDNLLLSTLNCREELGAVGFFEFLACLFLVSVSIYTPNHTTQSK